MNSQSTNSTQAPLQIHHSNRIRTLLSRTGALTTQTLGPILLWISLSFAQVVNTTLFLIVLFVFLAPARTWKHFFPDTEEGEQEKAEDIVQIMRRLCRDTGDISDLELDGDVNDKLGWDFDGRGKQVRRFVAGEVDRDSKAGIKKQLRGRKGRKGGGGSWLEGLEEVAVEGSDSDG